MKTNEFIAKVRKGDSAGKIEITIPQAFYRINGLTLGEEYVFIIKAVENGV